MKILFLSHDTLLSLSISLLSVLIFLHFLQPFGKPIARATETPSLGLIIDEALTWEPYIHLLSFKTAYAISAIKQANFLPKKSL